MRITTTAALAAAGAFLSLAAVSAHAQDTLQVVSGPTGGRGAQILAFGPIGQSFTAIDTNLTSFGLQFQTFNSGSAAASVLFRLLAGDGLGGAQLYSRSLTLPSDLPARTGVFYDFDITGANVLLGQRYTAVVSSTTNRYGVALGPEYNIFTGAALGGDAYSGGQAYFGTTPFDNCANPSNCDLNFRVTGFNSTAAVPEASTWAMMLVGFGLVGATTRRRTRRATLRQVA